MSTLAGIESSLYTFISIAQITVNSNLVGIVWPNEIKSGTDSPPVPRIEVSRTADNNRALGLSTSSVVSSSLALVIVTELGNYISQRNDILLQFESLFTLHRDIGDATITSPVNVRPGYRDGSEFRTPVFVGYTAIIQ